MAAFRRAIELGADGVELDVQATADHQLVVIHDVTLDRTTTLRGPVLASRWDAVAAADAGGWYDKAYCGERVPLLGDVLRQIDVRVEVELKGFTPEFAAAVVEAVAAAAALDRVEFTSGYPLLLERVRATAPSARIGCFAPLRPGWMPDVAHLTWTRATAEMVGADVVHFHGELIDEALVETVRSWGFALHAADVDDGDLRRVARLGVDQLSTARPDLARAAIDAPS